MNLKSILIVLNPGAGTSSAEEIESLIRDYFTSKPYHLNWYYTTGNEDAEKILQLTKELGPDILLAAGGDGTCNLVADISIKQKVPMGIIPAGSANALARELQIPLDPLRSLSLLSEGRIREIDVMRINGKLCIRQAGLGVNAELISSFEKSEGRGMKQYVIHFFQNIFKWRSFSVKIRTEKESLHKRHVISVTIASSRTYATGAIINPEGSLDDGKFEVILIHSFPWYTMPSLFIRLFTGKIHESIYSDIVSCEKAELSIKRHKLLQIDGELAGKYRQVNATINTKALQLLVPRETT